MDIIPSFLSTGVTAEYHDGNAFDSMRLYSGEVVEIIRPASPKSLTKRLVEYRVLVQTRQNGTAAVQEFPHCVLHNPLGGLADRAWWRLRADPKAGVGGKPALGSKVTILCINGERVSPLIVGGLRNDADMRDKASDDAEGQAAELVYNGVAFRVNDKGELTVTYEGPTKPDGTLDTKKAKEQKVGTSLTFGNDGSFTVATRKPGKKDEPPQQSVTIDNTKQTMTIVADKGWDVQVTGPATVKASGVTVTAEKSGIVNRAEGGSITHSAPKGKLFLGGDADEPVPLGNTLKGLLEQLCQETAAITVPSPFGPLGPPINAPKIAAIRAQLVRFLSQYAFVRKTPG